jgi:hypothetical protein
MEIEKRTNEIFKQHPEANILYVTKDGQIFFSKFKAERNNKNKGFTEDLQEFFREGYTPENGEDLDEMEILLEETLQENKTLKDANAELVESIKILENVKSEFENVSKEKDALQVENQELKNSLKALQDELNKVSETPKNAKK